MKYSGDSRDIELRLYREEGCGVVRVVDHGPGIPESEQEGFREFLKAVRTGRVVSGIVVEGALPLVGAAIVLASSTPSCGRSPSC
jgi:hypothetical protein